MANELFCITANIQNGGPGRSQCNLPRDEGEVEKYLS